MVPPPCPGAAPHPQALFWLCWGRHGATWPLGKLAALASVVSAGKSLAWSWGGGGVCLSTQASPAPAPLSHGCQMRTRKLLTLEKCSLLACKSPSLGSKATVPSVVGMEPGGARGLGAGSSGTPCPPPPGGRFGLVELEGPPISPLKVSKREPEPEERCGWWGPWAILVPAVLAPQPAAGAGAARGWGWRGGGGQHKLPCPHPVRVTCANCATLGLVAEQALLGVPWPRCPAMVAVGKGPGSSSAPRGAEEGFLPAPFSFPFVPGRAGGGGGPQQPAPILPWPLAASPRHSCWPRSCPAAGTLWPCRGLKRNKRRCGGGKSSQELK